LACQYREGTGKFKKNLETKVEFLQKASEMGYDKGNCFYRIQILFFLY